MATGNGWLMTYMRRLGLSKQDVQLVLGVNPARVHEWLKGEKQLPQDVVQRLNRWEAAGCPRFEYWEQRAA
jgi:plasmid maintenance system antidote protein VapI